MPELHALHQRHDHGVRRQQVRPGRQVGPQRLRRHREHHDLGAADRLGRVRGGRDRRRQDELRQVVGVDVLLVDLGDQLGAPAPHPHLVAGVGQDRGVRRSPAAGAEHGCAPHGLGPLGRGRCRRRRPVPGTAGVAGVGQAGDAGVEPLRRRLLPADLLQQGGDRIEQAVRRLAQHLTRQRAALQVRQVHRRPGPHVHRLAGQQPGPVGVRREQLLGTPLRHRDQGAPGGQRDARGTGLAGHRPQVRVTGQGALREDRHALALVHRVHRGTEGLGRLAGAAVDGDLLGVGEHPAEHGDAEDAVLGEEERRVAVVVEEVREGDRVGVRQVVGAHDEPAGAREVLGSAPVAAGQGLHHQPQQGRDEPVGPRQLPIRAYPPHSLPPFRRGRDQPRAGSSVCRSSSPECRPVSRQARPA